MGNLPVPAWLEPLALKVLTWVAAPKTQVKFNGLMSVLWLIMVPLTVALASLRTAIFWVAFMSVWANFATHLGGWIAALVNTRAEDIQATSKEMVTLTHIEQLVEGLANGQTKTGTG